MSGPTARNINEQLNLSAQQISMIQSKSDPQAWGRGTASFATNGSLTGFNLTGVNDLFQPISLQETDGPPLGSNGARFILEKEYNDMWNRYESGQDENGRWLWYLAYDPSAPTQPWTVLFIQPPPTRTWTLIYHKIVASLDLDSAVGDTSTFAEVPIHSHNLIAQHAAVTIMAQLGHPGYQNAVQIMGDMLKAGAFLPEEAKSGDVG